MYPKSIGLRRLSTFPSLLSSIGRVPITEVKGLMAYPCCHSDMLGIGIPVGFRLCGYNKDGYEKNGGMCCTKSIKRPGVEG